MDLIEKLTNILTTIDCVKNIVLTLCELLDIVWQNKSFRINDPQIASMNDILMNQIYEVFFDYSVIIQ